MIRQIVVNTYLPEEARNMTPEEVRVKTEELTQLRKSMIKLLLRYKANINVVDKEGKTLFDRCLDSRNYELLELFTDVVSFSVQPSLLFSFAGLIYKPELKRTFDYLMKNSAGIDEAAMNVLDADGFTPFLRYLQYFVEHSVQWHQSLTDYIQFQLKRLKFQGAQDFGRDNLQLRYDNYMQPPPAAVTETDTAIHRYILYFYLPILIDIPATSITSEKLRQPSSRLLL